MPSDIAVIGLAGRFPGAASVAEFWRNVRNGVESIRFFTPDEQRGSVPEAQLADPRYVPAKGYLDDWESFDAAFFGYPAREAALMDPQIRLLHECVWEALEDAGYAPDSGLGSVGLYIGGSSSPLWFCASQQRRRTPAEQYQGVVMNDNQAFSTRLSYRLGLRGPSFTMQTACSSSLVALHVACRALLAGECRMAVTGGVSIVFPVMAGYVYEEGGVASPDGHCRAFDAGGRGTLAGDGCALAVLKPLAAALADGDRIYAVVRGTAINNDGNDKIGYTAPSVSGQADVIRQALAAAGVEAETIGYLEAHGTGTPLGDPIEIEAATQAFGTRRRQFCAVGSVKTNVGHLNHAAGIAGFIKAVMAVHDGVLPPSLHYRTANPHIDFASTPFYVNAELRRWASDGPRRAAVSSFGIGGTNAHAILEEAPLPLQQAQPGSSWHLLVLSAKAREPLERAASRLAAHLDAHAGVCLADVAYTLQVGRSAHAWRRAVLCRDPADAAQALRTSAATGVRDGSCQPASGLAYLLPGQGAQYPGMAAGLYRRFSIVRAAIDECLALLGGGLRRELEAALGLRDATREEGERIHDTRLAQPALFISEYACATFLRRLGLAPTMFLGHSLGEIVAAALAGVFRLGDVLALVALRAELMQALPRGAMLSVALGADDVQEWLTPDLSLAVVNAPDRCVVSGAAAAIDELAIRLAREGIASRRLAASHAFHSAAMEPMLAEFGRAVAAVPRRPPAAPFLSNVTGRWITRDEAIDPAYWVRQVREPVRFSDNADALVRARPAGVVDLGPGDALSVLVRSHPARKDDMAVAALMRRASEREDDDACALRGVGQLWVRGFDLDWTALHDAPRRRVSLPTYPFERERLPDITIEPRAADPEPAARPRTIFYAPVWQRAAARPAPDAGSARRLLLFAPARSAGALADACRSAGHDVVLVRQAERFGRPAGAAREFGIRPSERGDYARLLEELEPGWSPTHVVHAWSLDAGADERRRADVHAAREAGFYSVLWLAQAIASPPIRGGVHVQIVTRDATDAPGTRTISPAQSPAAALGVVVSQECSGLRCTHADVSGDDLVEEGEVAVLRRAIDAGLGDPQPAVAWRRGVAWTPAVVPWPAPDAAPRETALRSGGVYVITGGFGDIGLSLAEEWVRASGARIALVGRSVPAAPDPRAARVARLVSEGADMLTFAADCTDRERMQAVFDAVRGRWGAVHGVVHAAAATRGPSIATPVTALDRAACDEQFAAKAQGLLVLRDLLRGDEPDFVLVASSLAASLGGLGLGAYAAACRFQDACVEAWSRESRTRWIAVDWDGWDFPGRGRAFSRRLDLLHPAEGVDACTRLVATAGPPRILVSKADLRVRRQQWLDLEAARDAGRARPPAEQAIQGGPSRSRGAEPEPTRGSPSGSPAGAPEPMRGSPSGSPGGAPKPMRGSPSGSPGGAPEPMWGSPSGSPGGAPEPMRGSPSGLPDAPTPVAVSADEQLIAAVWQEYFGAPHVGPADNFFDLGGDSLGAIALVARLNAALSCRLHVSDLLETPTVAQLSARLRRRSGAPALPRIERAEERQAYPLSFEQEAVLAPRNATYPTRFNCTAALDVDEPLDPDRLEQAFRCLVARHEVFRTSFDVTRGLQRIAASARFALGVRPASDAEADDACARFVRPFEVAQAPLVRADLLQLPHGRSRLLFDVHHAITDAVSLGTMLSELWAVYRGDPLPPVGPQYRDYTLWQRRVAALRGARDEEFWRRELEKCSWTELPADVHGAPRSVKQIAVAVDAALRADLRAACDERRVTLSTVLIAAVAAALGEYTRQDDVTFGVRVSRRSDASLERMLGPFVEDAVCRVRLDDARGEHDIVAATRQSLAAILDSRACPYERLNAALQAERPTPTGDLFTVMVNYVPDVAATVPHAARFALVPRPPDTQYLVNLRIRDGAALRLDAKYRADRYTDCFVREFLERIVASAREIASGLAAHGAVVGAGRQARS